MNSEASPVAGGITTGTVEDSTKEPILMSPLDEHASPKNSVFDRRRSGVLLHPTSIPGPWQSGVLGKELSDYIDFLAAAGFSVWQTLPLGPVGSDLSPYNCYSVFAINPRLIDPEWYVAQGYLDSLPAYQQSYSASFEQDLAYRAKLSVLAWQGFLKHSDQQHHELLQSFRDKQSYWIEDFALYSVIKVLQNGDHWKLWPSELLHREPAALEKIRRDYAVKIDQIIFEQYVVQEQWQNLQVKAAENDILLFGDLPMYVAHDSAEAWSQRDYFTINSEGSLDLVAGVPPDYFSETGQLWGNPLYNWKRMEHDGFDWWKHRLGRQLELYDLVRIDHFRGFEAYWEVPGDAKSALAGHWVKAPGDKLFSALREKFPNLPVVAEDLGLITEEVTALRHKHHMPGMKVMQFGFDGKPENPHLPENFEPDYVVYTGTHDNDTTLAWYESLPEEARQCVDSIANITSDITGNIPWLFIQSAIESKALYAIIPMQDLLALGGGHRMNTPGTVNINWQWRCESGVMTNELESKLFLLNQRSSRIA